jgi:hypothetical protein
MYIRLHIFQPDVNGKRSFFVSVVEGNQAGVGAGTERAALGHGHGRDVDGFNAGGIQEGVLPVLPIDQGPNNRSKTTESTYTYIPFSIERRYLVLGGVVGLQRCFTQQGLCGQARTSRSI